MRRVAGILLVMYLAVLAGIAFWPTPVDRPVYATLFTLVAHLRAEGLTWMSYAGVESAANAVLFVPFGLLLAGLLGRGWRLLALAICVAATFTIEFLQLELLSARTADVRDIVANSIGAALGVAAVAVADRVHARRVRRRAARAASRA